MTNLTPAPLTALLYLAAIMQLPIKSVSGLSFQEIGSVGFSLNNTLFTSLQQFELLFIGLGDM